MYEQATPTAAAGAAAEAIRTLNHLSFGKGFEYPSDAYATIGELATLLHRLPQALAQIQQFLGQQHAAGRIVADWGSYAARTDEAIQAALVALDNAALQVNGAAAQIDAAHTATAGLSQAGAA